MVPNCLSAWILCPCTWPLRSTSRKWLYSAPADLARWRPYSERATVIWAGDFGPLPHPDSINTDDETRLLEAIPTDAVWQAVQAKLADI